MYYPCTSQGRRAGRQAPSVQEEDQLAHELVPHPAPAALPRLMFTDDKLYLVSRSGSAKRALTASLSSAVEFGNVISGNITGIVPIFTGVGSAFPVVSVVVLAIFSRKCTDSWFETYLESEPEPSTS